MKSKRMKRILALALCMVLLLGSTGITSWIGVLDANETEANQSTTEENEDVAVVEETGEPTSEPTPEAQPTEEPQADESQVPDADNTTTEQPAAEPAEESTIVQEATQLEQSFVDADGNTVGVVTADIPEETFPGAEASAITMEVSDTTDQGTLDEITHLINNSLAADKQLGSYFLYDVRFLVDGVVTEPTKAVTITIEKSGFQIEDTNNAHVFYYNPANSVEGNTEAELREITQRADMIKALQDAGMSTDTMDEDYDLSQIALKADGTMDKTIIDGRRSTVYGLYTEEQKPEETVSEEPTTTPDGDVIIGDEDIIFQETTPAETKTYEDKEVTVTVTADKAGVIPKDTTLQVLPILSDDKETKDQYKEVKEQLEKKAEDEAYDIAGFLAYDISFVDKDGKEVEPSGDVKVTIDYKQEAIPEEVDADADLDVTVMHLEENTKGDVKEVVDMVADASKEAAVETTEDAKVKKAEFITDSFSYYTVTWTYEGAFNDYTKDIRFYYYDRATATEFAGPEVEGVGLQSGQYLDLTNERLHAATVGGKSYVETRIGSSYDQSDVATAIKATRSWGNWSYTYKDSDGEENSYSGTPNVYLVYKDPSSGGETGGESALGAPQHTKTIKKNSDTDYTLSLDVTGAVQSVDPINVLLIVDVSGSMDDNDRYKNANTAISELLTKLSTAKTQNPNLQINMAMTSFADVGGKHEFGWQTLDSFKNRSWKLTDALCSGGTNWEDGLYYGDNLLKSKTGANTNYVVFLTDGNPTRWIKSSGTSYDGSGQETDGNIKSSYDNALARWKKTEHLKDTTTFVVKASSSAAYCDDFVKAMNGEKSEVASLVDGTSKATIQQGFANIASKIAPDAYKNVSITDTLSEYVDFPDGFTQEDVSVVTVTKNANGTETETPFTGAYTTTVNTSNKQVTVNLLNGGTLAKDVTYRIKFDVVPSTKAYEEYDKNGATNRYNGVVGDTGTDSWDNEPDTSSNKAGFYSNNSTESYVAYSTTLDSGLKDTYAKPVIQVTSQKTSLEFDKVDSAGKPVQGAKFALTKAKETTAAYTAISDAQGKVKFENISAGEYILSETEAAPGYVKNESTRVVKVEMNSDGELVAKMYENDGVTEITGDDRKVINYTSEEFLETVLDYNKTATVDNWDKRTYDINITASSEITSTTTSVGTSVVDTMLVFDLSGSMNAVMNTVNNKELGRYNSIKGTLDTTKVYYYNSSVETTYSGDGYSRYTNPMVYLDDKWQYYNGSTWTTIADNATGQVRQWNSRITALKEASIAFVKSMSASPNSKLGISSFAGTYSNNSWSTYGTLHRELTAIGSNTSDIIKTICQLKADAGTSPQKGLDIANTQMSALTDANPKSVILFSDGKPSSDDDETETETSAAKIKGDGDVKLYTIGLGLTTETANWLQNTIATQSDDPKVKYAFTADTADQLRIAFNTVFTSTTTSSVITGAQIKDVIDPRFVILDDSGNPITNDYEGIANGITLDNGGTVYYDAETGYQFIVWNDQTISKPSDNGWSRTIKVQAKETYIGGNAVTTNISPDSIISTGYGTAILPQPAVNVKTDLLVNNKEITIYKGDSVPMTDDILKTLFDTSAPKGMVDGKQVTYTMNTAGNAFSADDFTLKWYSDADCTQEITDWTSIKPDATISYYLKVTYDAGTPTDASTENTSNNIAGGDDYVETAKNSDTTNYPNKEYGVYKVNVISGTIQITKTIEKAADADQTFTFNVKDAKGNLVKTIEITITKGQTTASYTGTDLNNLSRGTYVVTEADKENYNIQNAAIGTNTNTYNSLDAENSSATFILGDKKLDASGTNVISPTYTYNSDDGGTIGQVVYTNEAVASNWEIVKVNKNDHETVLAGAEFELTSKGSPAKTYYGRSDVTGKVLWYESSNITENSEPVAKIAAGTYTLEETKAPNGYSISTEKWQLNIKKNGIKTIHKLKADGTVDAEVTDKEAVVSGDKTTMKFYYGDAMLYSLPSTGGSGIFWYTIGGVLLMLAASLILYKKRLCEGVLKR